MVVENKTTLVIMLCPCMENDKEMSMEYYPSTENPAPREFGKYKVTLDNQQEPFEGIQVRNLLITVEASEDDVVISHKFRHIQQTDWKDNCAPSDSQDMIDKV